MVNLQIKYLYHIQWICILILVDSYIGLKNINRWIEYIHILKWMIN